MGRPVDIETARLRRETLREWVAAWKREGKTQKDFAHKIGRSPAQLSHWLTARNPMDYETARSIEISLNKPPGSMDGMAVNEPDGAPISSGNLLVLEAPAHDALTQSMIALMTELPTEGKRAVLRAAYLAADHFQTSKREKASGE